MRLAPLSQVLIFSALPEKRSSQILTINTSQCFRFLESPGKYCWKRNLLNYPAWGQAGSPRNGTCGSWLPGGSWEDLGPRKRDGGLSGSPAASSLGEHSATTGGHRRGGLIKTTQGHLSECFGGYVTTWAQAIHFKVLIRIQYSLLT